MNTLDMSEILLEAYQLADHINECKEVKQYLELKQRIEKDDEAQRLIAGFRRKKDRFEEAQRFGHFHPDYHAAKKEAEAFLKEMEKHPLIGRYLEAEEQVDRLLSEVSRTLAQAVSDSIKVPINDPRELRQANLNRRKGCG
ncbi:YlbF family regulator [Desmospora profundinema]|uniref:Cell fate (Sporulation/competence/biofilm development) regulator YlbF (YheA/YmcA/DUF963 family) n=1 Tax=Desmospora profundinema TaxID=1571184 RepID=A0ABU1IKH5_9BACL|nr:YlbF family regulator [Desmospora profundinema]MDR6225268.1 cell fate (sporulation/competence/biofilm development) regulator YlbF (YheA/YmcA/DUF963 family) [Desmospora profundinema]